MRVLTVRTVVTSCLVLLSVAASSAAVCAQEGSAGASQPMLGTEAPGFVLETTAGETLSLQDLRGKYVVIHFGASW